jgi:hypothetical protein
LSTGGGKEFVITREGCGGAATSGTCDTHVNINYECGDCPEDCGPGLVCAERINAWGTNFFYDLCIPDDECGRDIVYYAYGGPPGIAFGEFRHIGAPQCTKNRYDDELEELEDEKEELEEELEAYEELAEGYGNGNTGDVGEIDGEEIEALDENSIMHAVRKADPEKWEATDQATFEAITPELWEWIGHHSIRYSDMKTSSEEREAVADAADAAEGEGEVEGDGTAEDGAALEGADDTGEFNPDSAAL